MKKLILMLMTLCIITTGCFKRDNLEDITIYTTAYPIEYITNILYKDHSKIYSIYPPGSDISTYNLTKKQIKEYSKMDLYIFNGLSSEKNYVNAMFKYNKNLMIIDSTQSMEVTYDMSELWINPSNFLMISLNIKNGLLRYINNHYLTEEINKKYEELKINISNIDAKLKLMSENSSNPTLIVDNNALKFLEKYGFKIISLEENDSLTEKVINDAKSLLKSDLTYIYTLDKDNLNNTVKKIIEETNAKTIELNKLSTLTEEQKNDKADYISLMNENIEHLKEELYN